MDVCTQDGPGPLRFRGRPVGYLSHVAGRGGPAQVYRETVELAVAAEELGFASFWVAQHHAGALEGLLPSPLVLLGAVAERTSTIRLGTAVVAAALEDPRRLAEDAAVVDVLSGGRLELGVGAGADAAASAAFGRDHDRRHHDCERVVDVLCAELTGSWLVPAATGLRSRLWWATGSAAGVDAAADRGIGVLSGRPAHLPGTVEGLFRYRCAAADPRVALCRVVPAGEPGAAQLDRWAADPALPSATELVVQTGPAAAGFSAHLGTLRAVSAAVRSALAAGTVRP
ncbi:LLM class flavin-dependent oxidoreductase [Pseudonocardia humida]|uniref:LLM class flavin-dependent oxidoreductase n=1 Tax=Pseudonocardia humida TaxID=2800819 RepID=A0ABT1A0E0_9PSEU|nr:LLM class flavin-dependent oxidoreductase [Pseudonocardia humida]MCO1656470.1 LLM class flavin-dependent oxidoreductase [Pseudonocardia humida]